MTKTERIEAIRCPDCRYAIHADDDDARVCIQCGGMNRRHECLCNFVQRLVGDGCWVCNDKYDAIVARCAGMSETDDYQRGYRRGYYAGTKVRSEEQMRHLAEIRQTTDRAERAERAQGLGTCSECRHYAARPGCKWGQCTKSLARDIRLCSSLGPIWFSAEGGLNAQHSHVFVSCAFGCVMFEPKPGA